MHKPSTLDLPTVVAGTWILAFWSCAAVILVLSLIPPPEEIPSTGWDKSNHVVAFSVLAILGFRAYRAHLAAVILGLICYGTVIEILQSFTPDHFGEWKDLFADCVGISLGCMLEVFLRKAKAWQT